MVYLDDFKNKYSARLDAIKSEQDKRLEDLLKRERERLLRDVQPALPEIVARRMHEQADRLDRSLQPAKNASPVQQRIDLSGGGVLSELDALFVRTFELGRYYPVQKLEYPTVYCETLEEFHLPILQQIDVSPQVRQAMLDRTIQDAKEALSGPHGVRIYGVNLPGRGCYLNGWVFAYELSRHGRQVTPAQALSSPEALPGILATAAHEKLGHGFLSVYSLVGQAAARNGLNLVEWTGRFGLRPADDALASLRQQQARLLFSVSQLLEEGYSTWIENYLIFDLQGRQPHRRYTLQNVMRAILDLPAELEERERVQGVLYEALRRIFSEDLVGMPDLHEAVKIVSSLGEMLDPFFMQVLGQPLRYAIGDLLMARVAVGCGAKCVPYAALIAANINVDLDRLGLVDLFNLFTGDPRLSPDTRLAAISQLAMTHKDQVGEMARLVESQLSLSVPPEIRQAKTG